MMAEAIALELEAEHGWHREPKTSGKISVGVSLLGALEDARLAKNLIYDAQQELFALRENATTEVERDARDYQIWLIEQQLGRATELAEKRLDYFNKIKTSSQVEEELRICKGDKKHWFEYYAWGFDPRPDAPINTMPFRLFAFQKRFIDWLDYIVFTTRQSGVVPKSRDMGATETALRWGIHNWLFRDGFEALLLSRTEDEVDSKKDVNTLFEKIRFQLRLLPEWMLPKGFDLSRDMPYMLIQNPENKSTFHGRAPTENVGRQLRVAWIHYDEYAFAPSGGYKQHTSLGSTSKSLVSVSSVGGKLNKFADLCHDGRTPQFVMDWREHEWKDERWYKALSTGIFGPAMTTQQIAQEVDRDFDASQPGKVWKCKEEYTFIDWEELVKAHEPFGLANRFIEPYTGQYKIPDDWSWRHDFDYGQTTGHEWAFTISARPSKFYPYSDTVFVFLSDLIQPTGATEEQAYSLWCKWEHSFGLRDKYGAFIRPPSSATCSHEQKDLRETLFKEFGEIWYPWDTDYTKGIPQIQLWFGLIEKNKPNPYRPFLNGRTRIVFVAPKGEYSCQFDERNGCYYVTPSKIEKDKPNFSRVRAEIGAYHYPEEERFKPVHKMRPAKFFDDCNDTLRAIGVDWGGDVPDASKDEQYLQHIRQNAPELLREKIAAIPDEEQRSMAISTALLNRMEWEKQQAKTEFVNDDFNEFIRQGNDIVPEDDWREL